MSAVDFTSVNFTGRVVNFTVPFLLTKKKLKTPPKIGAVGGRQKKRVNSRGSGCVRGCVGGGEKVGESHEGTSRGRRERKGQ